MNNLISLIISHTILLPFFNSSVCQYIDHNFAAYSVMYRSCLYIIVGLWLHACLYTCVCWVINVILTIRKLEVWNALKFIKGIAKLLQSILLYVCLCCKTILRDVVETCLSWMRLLFFKTILFYDHLQTCHLIRHLMLQDHLETCLCCERLLCYKTPLS